MRPRSTPWPRFSIGYWQASRIQSLLGNAIEARRYAEVSLAYSEGLKPFYLGYAFEALARAESIAGNPGIAAEQVAKAKALADQVGDQKEREQLLGDLRTIESSQSS